MTTYSFQRNRYRKSTPLILIIPCIPIYLVRYAYNKLKARYYRSERMQLKRLRENWPQPPKVKKQSVLRYLESEIKKSKPEARRADQSASRLCGLPVEIRLLIYEYVLESKGIHVFLSTANKSLRGSKYGKAYERRLYGMSCPWPVARDHVWEMMLECRCGRDIEESCAGIPHYEFPSPRLGVGGIMKSCRFLYEEVVDAVYARCTFLFHAPESLLLFSSYLPLHLRDKIGSIHLNGAKGSKDFQLPLLHMPNAVYKRHISSPPLYPCTNSAQKPNPSVWGAMCATLAQMKGLRHLEVSLSLNSFQSVLMMGIGTAKLVDDRKKSERFIIGPLAHVKKSLGEQLRMDVEVDWVEREEGDVTEGVLTVRRREAVDESFPLIVDNFGRSFYWLGRQGLSKSGRLVKAS